MKTRTPAIFFVIIAPHGLEKDSKPKENKQDDTLFPLTAQGRPSSSSFFTGTAHDHYGKWLNMFKILFSFFLFTNKYDCLPDCNWKNLWVNKTF